MRRAVGKPRAGGIWVAGLSVQLFGEIMNMVSYMFCAASVVVRKCYAFKVAHVKITLCFSFSLHNFLLFINIIRFIAWLISTFFGSLFVPPVSARRRWESSDWLLTWSVT